MRQVVQTGLVEIEPSPGASLDINGLLGSLRILLKQHHKLVLQTVSP